MNYLVCYDITDNKLRKKIADKLFYYGLSRVQLSVFIGYVNDIHFERMHNDITQKMDEEKNATDSIIFLRINYTNLQKMIIFGNAKADSDYIKNSGHTIYI